MAAQCRRGESSARQSRAGSSARQRRVGPSAWLTRRNAVCAIIAARGMARSTQPMVFCLSSRRRHPVQLTQRDSHAQSKSRKAVGAITAASGHRPGKHRANLWRVRIRARTPRSNPRGDVDTSKRRRIGKSRDDIGAVIAARGTDPAEQPVRSSPRKVVDVVNVAQNRGVGDAARRQRRLGVGHGMFGRPADPGEKIARQRGRTLHPDQPIAAVGRGPQHGVVPAQSREGPRHMDPLDSRDIAPHDANGPRRQASEHARHPGSQISAALRDPRRTRSPDPAGQAHGVRRDGQNEPPPGIFESPYQPRRLVTEPPSRADLSDPLGQPRLDPPGPRLLQHDHQPPHPAKNSSSIRP